MTEITRVPLQPIAKGSVSKLWLGVIAAVVAGGTVAAVARPPMVSVETLVAGKGAHPTASDVVMIAYQGRLKDGTVFDQNERALMPMEGVIPGFIKAMSQTQKGGKYVFHIPSSQAYGAKAVGPIPANSDLTFQVEVMDFMNRAELEQRQRMMEQMMRQGGGAPGGAAGGAPVPPPVQ
ncbi:FKBP-type peptidyl-prolyl cis-trans isomerase [Novosphingobium sp. FSY-8]|uniref:Peptidyl-prolyl cis-trans isomerase n=1 Tax=Novosphingobium ovatum TaxID=1908523 RepID=A0ABW9XEA6_9SPHN|nr:FKBP-type peptidyl-prolyl cis-trans isomerase [Novosphingobium ovatum]NBC36782.1 FKBP-type peptidyl-prolyl cis-trans isomerase [Novosphingobium ovatum]